MGNSQAVPTQCPSRPKSDRVPVAHPGNLLLNMPCIVFLSSLSHFPTPQLTFPRIVPEMTQSEVILTNILKVVWLKIIECGAVYIMTFEVWSKTINWALFPYSHHKPRTVVVKVKGKIHHHYWRRWSCRI